MSPAACAGCSPGPRSESLGTAGLLRVFSETSTPAPLGVRVGLVLGLKAADLGAVFCGALLRAGGRGAVLARLFAGQELARRLGGLRLRGVTQRASWPQNPAPSCGSGWSGPSQGPCRQARRRARFVPAGKPRQRPRRVDVRTTHL
jgi:hypothetical protein